MPSVVRAVLDTVVFVRSLINHRSRWGRLVFEHGGDYQLVVSEPVVVEIVQVLRRPELVALFQTLPGRDPAAVLALLADAETVDLPATFPRVSRDPKDDMFLATAKAGDAGYVVSEDRDRLDLDEYEGIRIVTAEAFLQMLGEGEQR